MLRPGRLLNHLLQVRFSTNFGNLSQSRMPPDMPADVREQAVPYFQALASGHDSYGALSTRGHNQLVADSMNFIQFENPAAVLAAISRVLGPPHKNALAKRRKLKRPQRQNLVVTKPE